MEEIRVTYASIEMGEGGAFTIIYIPDQRQILEAGRRYKIIIDGLTYGTSGKAKAKRRAR